MTSFKSEYYSGSSEEKEINYKDKTGDIKGEIQKRKIVENNV
jgi:hypothetical protein